MRGLATIIFVRDCERSGASLTGDEPPTPRFPFSDEVRAIRGPDDGILVGAGRGVGASAEVADAASEPCHAGIRAAAAAPSLLSAASIGNGHDSPALAEAAEPAKAVTDSSRRPTASTCMRLTARLLCRWREMPSLAIFWPCDRAGKPVERSNGQQATSSKQGDVP
jgi:hypothetical protein